MVIEQNQAQRLSLKPFYSEIDFQMHNLGLMSKNQSRITLTIRSKIILYAENTAG